ncbi:hypothetical protein RSAG8_10844, partial [Rhizoctonia solani AG-8 WAC10335]
MTLSGKRKQEMECAARGQTALRAKGPASAKRTCPRLCQPIVPSKLCNLTICKNGIAVTETPESMPMSSSTHGEATASPLRAISLISDHVPVSTPGGYFEWLDSSQ